MENWRLIAGFEEYSVSDMGAVRRNRSGRILRQCSQDRYQYVCLYKQNRARRLRVHRLVMGAFVGPCPIGQEVDHLNQNRGDNRLSNLEYVAHCTNRQRAGRLSWPIVNAIRDEHAKGMGPRAIAARFGISPGAVDHVVHRRRWIA